MGEAYQAKRGPEEERNTYARRLSYLIDPEGRIAKSYEVTDIPAHVDEVVSDLRGLAART